MPQNVGVVNWKIKADKTDNILDAEDKSSHYYLYRHMEKEKLQEHSVTPFMLSISMGY